MHVICVAMRRFFNGHNHRQLLCSWLNDIDRAMLLLALYPCDRDHGIADTESVNNCKKSLYHRIHAWIYSQKTRRVSSGTFMYRVIASGNVSIFKMLAPSSFDTSEYRAIMKAAVKSGSVDMIRAVWDANVYCEHNYSHGQGCCVDIAARCGHFELAERLSWSWIRRHVWGMHPINNFIARGEFAAINSVCAGNDVCVGNDVCTATTDTTLDTTDTAENTDLVCWRDVELYNKIPKFTRRHTEGNIFNILQGIQYQMPMLIPYLKSLHIIKGLAKAGNVDAINHIYKVCLSAHTHLVHFTGCTYEGAVRGGHLNVVKWAREIDAPDTGIKILYKAIKYQQKEIFAYALGYINARYMELFPCRAAKVGYDMYITVYNMCAERLRSDIIDTGVEFVANPTVEDQLSLNKHITAALRPFRTLFSALKSGDIRTIEHAFSNCVYISKDGNYLDVIGMHQEGTVDIMHEIYICSRGNIKVMQWINDNIGKPSNCIEFVKDVHPWSKRMGVVQKLIELGACLTAKSLENIISSEDILLLQWLNTRGYITEEILGQLQPKTERRGYDIHIDARENMRGARTKKLRFYRVNTKKLLDELLTTVVV